MLHCVSIIVTHISNKGGTFHSLKALRAYIHPLMLAAQEVFNISQHLWNTNLILIKLFILWEKLRFYFTTGHTSLVRLCQALWGTLKMKCNTK